MKLVEEVEYLGTQIQSLVEAEDLAMQVQSNMLGDIRKLYYSSVNRLIKVASKILKFKPVLGSAGPRVSMEALERLFIVLRDQAEITLARASKLHGKDARLGMAKADKFAKLTRNAAQSLKMTAEVRGIWTDKYAAELGLEPWVM